MSPRRHLILSSLILLFGKNLAFSQLSLTITEYTTDRLSFTISGTFAEDTIGDWEGWLAIKNDYQNNIGVHTELFTAIPTVESNTLTFQAPGAPSPVAVSTSIENGSQSYNDSIYWQNPGGFANPISALTVVNGSVTLSGANIFDPVNNNQLTLVSGITSSPYDWARLEAAGTAIPEPVHFASLLAFVSVVFFLFHRKKRLLVP